MINLFGMESISFQSSAFFNDLVQAVAAVRQTAKPMADEQQYYKQPSLLQITKIIRDYTGLKVEWSPEFSEYGPILLTPIYTLNHPFFSTAEREFKAPYLDPAEFVQRMNKPLYKGTIDLEHAKVTGDFCEILQRIAVPQCFMQLGRWRDEAFSVEEVAATLLHEVGHAFIELEFLDRTVTTNQVLSGLSASLTGTDEAQKKLAYSTAALRLRLTPQQTKALEEAQNDDSVTVIMATLAVEKSRSELGASVFDQTACEHLADQFAARHGAASYLLTSMAKVVERSPEKGYNWRWSRDMVLYSLVGLVFLPITLLVLFNVGEYEDKYGSFRTRALRIRNEIMQQLKNRTIAQAEKHQLLEALETADELIDSESPKLTFFQGVAYYVNSTYRHDHDYRLLQQKLEAYAHNNLFGHAARLSAL